MTSHTNRRTIKRKKPRTQLRTENMADQEISEAEAKEIIRRLERALSLWLKFDLSANPLLMPPQKTPAELDDLYNAARDETYAILKPTF